MPALVIVLVAVLLALAATAFLLRRGSSVSRDLRGLEDEAFGHRLGTAFGARGYHVVHREHEPGPVQLLLEREGKRYLVHYRYWRADFVGATPVLDLVQAVKTEQADGAYLVTTGRFTQEARNTAQEAGIELISGKELRSLLGGSPEKDLPA